MHPRRQKLTQWIALQTAATVSRSPHDISELRHFPVREPGSGRSYTVIRLRTGSGATGWGECGRVSAADLDKARRAVLGRPATAFAVTTTQTPLDGAITTAMADITARIAKAPLYRLFGGPTRTKVRALVTLAGNGDAELKESLNTVVQAGFRAFRVSVPAPSARNHGQPYERSIRGRLYGLRASAPDNTDFVLDGGGQLTAGDAAKVAGSLERFHPLWFDEPCPLANLQTIRKISDESVTPLGFGRDITQASAFQDLLREGVVDILRPDLQVHGIVRIRQIAAMAETYYTAVAPHHEGGPVGTAAALHLAASLPNFFIQHLPFSPNEQDRQMHAEMIKTPIDSVREGFIALPTGPGLGIDINEAALEQYKDTTA